MSGKRSSSQENSLPPISQIFNLAAPLYPTSSIALPPLRSQHEQRQHMPAHASRAPVIEMDPRRSRLPPGNEDPRHLFRQSSAPAGHVSYDAHSQSLPHAHGPMDGPWSSSQTRTGPWSAPHEHYHSDLHRQTNGYYPTADVARSGLEGYRFENQMDPYEETTSQPSEDKSGKNARYQCNYCGKGFLRPSALRIHLISHTGEKDFVCPDERCGRRFGVRSNMLRHVRLVHQNLQTNLEEDHVGPW